MIGENDTDLIIMVRRTMTMLRYCNKWMELGNNNNNKHDSHNTLHCCKSMGMFVKKSVFPMEITFNKTTIKQARSDQSYSGEAGKSPRTNNKGQ